MWLFTRKGFLSIVQHTEKRDMFIVRSRFPDHIQNLFPSAEVKVTPKADYRYRALIPRMLVAEAVLSEASGIQYPNFKDSLKGDPAYKKACNDVWYALLKHQKHGPEEKAGAGKNSDAIRRRYRAIKIPEMIGDNYWGDRLRTWEDFVKRGDQVARLLRKLKVTFPDDIYERDFRSLCPELHDLVMEVFPESSVNS